jgi:methylase of polypeptide subunit release factors
MKYTDKVYDPTFTSDGIIKIVNKLIDDGKKPDISILDVGCGCGYLGLTIKKQNPQAKVYLSDIDKNAIRQTKENAKGMDVTIFRSNLLSKPGNYHIIVANLPTYNDEDMTQVLHGPEVAYYSKEPLAIYTQLLKQARGRCKAIVCECQLKYQKDFLKLAKQLGYKLILSTEFSFAFLS